LSWLWKSLIVLDPVGFYLGLLWIALPLIVLPQMPRGFFLPLLPHACWKR